MSKLSKAIHMIIMRFSKNLFLHKILRILTSSNIRVHIFSGNQIVFLHSLFWRSVSSSKYRGSALACLVRSAEQHCRTSITKISNDMKIGWTINPSNCRRQSTLVCWDKWLLNHASDVPSIIFFTIQGTQNSLFLIL